MFYNYRPSLRMLSLLKKLAVSCCLLGGYLGLEQLIELHTKGFCFQKILADDLPYHSQWEIAPLEKEQQGEIEHILSQPFHLIGSGSECFAFMSEDGQTVIKFFKLGFARPVYYNKGLLSEDRRAYAGTLSVHPLLQKRWPGFLNTWKKRIFGIREFRLTRTFLSCKLAYEHLQEETGLFYLHLNPTDRFHRPMTLIDKNGITHQLPIDTSKFLLQRRAVPLERHFKELIDKKSYTDAEQSIDSLFILIINRCKKGFFDRDFIHRNLGYIGNKAIEIDLGSFLFDPHMADPLTYKKELFFATLELREWLDEHGAELLPYFDQKLQEELLKPNLPPLNGEIDQSVL